MAEILKKVKIDGVDYAWVTISDTEARLMPYDKTDKATKGKADKIKEKKDRLDWVKNRIKELQ